MLRKILFVVVLMLLVAPVLAQDDVISIEYDVASTIPFEADGGQAFLQFVGTEGDLVYVLGGETDIAFGSELTIDLRDSVGRSVGTRYEYAFDEFIIAELPSEGTYTVVITYDHDESNEVEVIVGQTAYITEDSLTMTIGEGNFATLMLLSVGESGTYALQVSQVNGDESPAISVVDFSEMFANRILSVDGRNLLKWDIATHFDDDIDYVVVISNAGGVFHTPYGMDEAEISLSLVPMGN